MIELYSYYSDFIIDIKLVENLVSACMVSAFFWVDKLGLYNLHLLCNNYVFNFTTSNYNFKGTTCSVCVQNMVIIIIQ